MEILSWPVFALAVPAVIFAGISKGGFGSGAAFASASILALVLEPGAALGLMLPLLMVIDVVSLPAYWRRWSWPESRLLIYAGLPGVGLGALFYQWTSADAIRLVIGLVCLLFIGWAWAQKSGLVRIERAMGRRAGVLAGVTLGFTSFVSHAGGPAAAVYLLGRKLDKTAFQASTVLVFWAINLSKVGIYGAMGIFSRETLLLGLALVPAALLGTWLGIRAHRLVPERVFFGVTYVLLAVTGSKLIFDALT
ncbi:MULTISPECIES: sulfite exporter TauE/SafE family protein [unclassified Roseivivax]|uniref:sulfite exporter TauE/SafE family protein n=1 Tax=Roseivivax sp. GX 12232 TaxID=2900547 RepID=UPI001E36907D|nr:sulfite exporter TauE/SafE family protein [Roseivivax sp. GX 12232]MCE0505554.1 sulfite exporter TauE/SafE family protein [Roseivivax sp. GX 12232]